MARPLRIELAGGLYHVTSRGDRREDIYFSDDDRQTWLEVLGQVCRRFDGVCHACAIPLSRTVQSLVKYQWQAS
jgi:hypothetical protein